MKIGIFTDRYLPQTDGISFSTETFRQELEKLGHEVYVFAPSPSWRYKDASSRIIRFPAIKGLFFADWLTGVYFPPQALKKIEHLKLDIIHCQSPSSIGLLGFYYGLHNHIPLATTYHTDLYEYRKHYPQILPGIMLLALMAPVITGGNTESYRLAMESVKPEKTVDKWNKKILVQGFTLFHNSCNLVIAPSKKMKTQLLKWKTKSRVEILPTGVDEITTTKAEIDSIRDKYNLNYSDKIVLLVCRIGTEKNIELLIEAFNTVGKTVPTAKLVIVGPGDDLSHYQKQAKASKYPNRIVFTGFVERRKLGAYYQLANVFAFPSLTDTQGMTVNEAACSGVPLVLVDREISEVLVDGENGFFANSKPKDFAAKIIKILSDDSLQKRMSKRSMQLGSEVSASKQAAKLLRLYQETIERYREPNSQKQPSSAQR